MSDGAGHDTGVVFPRHDGRRSTSAVGRRVVAAALAGVDPTGARAAEHDTNWRSGYLGHFRRLVEAGMASPDAWVDIARRGPAAVHEHMEVVTPDGNSRPLADGLHADGPRLRTVAMHGTAPARGFTVPFGERALGDDELRSQGRPGSPTAWPSPVSWLVADLHRPAQVFAHPWQAEGHEAVHGGLWRMPWSARSALGLAALLGYASSRG